MGMAESNKWQEFNEELQNTNSVKDVLSVYLFMDKEYLDPSRLDKIALKLLDFEDGQDKAILFIEMAEKRRSDEVLSQVIGQSIETALRISK